jgi:hypothetical protein
MDPTPFRRQVQLYGTCSNHVIHLKGTHKQWTQLFYAWPTVPHVFYTEHHHVSWTIHHFSTVLDCLPLLSLIFGCAASMHFLASFTLFTIPSAKSAALGTVEGSCLVAGVKGCWPY